MTVAVIAFVTMAALLIVAVGELERRERECDMCECDFDPPRLYTEGEMFSNGEVKCAECKELIPADEEFLMRIGVWDGFEADDFPICYDCQVAIKETEELAQEHNACFCYSLGDSKEAIYEFRRGLGLENDEEEDEEQDES